MPDNEPFIGEKHIMIAADASDNGRRAVLYVADILGGMPGFRATVVHIIPEPPEDFFRDTTEEERWCGEQRRVGEELVAKYKVLLVQSGFPEEKVDTEVIVKQCEPLAQCIFEEAERLGACTIAVGRRGMSTKEEFLHGSTSSSLMHLAQNCAVWVVE